MWGAMHTAKHTNLAKTSLLRLVALGFGGFRVARVLLLDSDAYVIMEHVRESLVGPVGKAAMQGSNGPLPLVLLAPPRVLQVHVPHV